MRISLKSIEPQLDILASLRMKHGVAYVSARQQMVYFRGQRAGFDFCIEISMMELKLNTTRRQISRLVNLRIARAILDAEAQQDALEAQRPNGGHGCRRKNSKRCSPSLKP